MQFTFEDRSQQLMNEVVELDNHIAFLKERKEFINNHFSTLDEDFDSNKIKISNKITTLQRKRQELSKKALNLLHNPLEYIANIQPKQAY